MLVFGLESSCDETAVGLVEDGEILSNVIASQFVHQDFGGVVPELAARDHIRNVLPVTYESLHLARKSLEDVDVFAVTHFPGLIGCLMVGSQFVKSLALAYQKPFYAINHLHAHVISPCMSNPSLEPPYLCLLASGGHTQIVHCKSFTDMEVIGTTLDDAAGEAFDKSARLLGFKHSGGLQIDKYAKGEDPHKFALPQPRLSGYDYSFSGLKTAIRYLIEREQATDATFVERNLSTLCASVQYAIIETLIKPLLSAAKDLSIDKLCIAGGVSANSYLRKRMIEETTKSGKTFYCPALSYCTDNGAMIAFLASKYATQNISFDKYSVACQARVK